MAPPGGQLFRISEVMRIPGRMAWASVAHIFSFLYFPQGTYGSSPPLQSAKASHRVGDTQREFFIDNLLVRVYRCFWCTGLAPWEFEFPFPCSLTSTLLFPFLLSHLPPSSTTRECCAPRRRMRPYRETSLISNSAPLRPSSRPMPGFLGGS